MARIDRLITTIDSHTAGESTRLVTSGLPALRGENLAARLADARARLAWVPGLLMLEPRGHKDTFGAVLVPPCDPRADFGLIFMDNVGYEPMCGHAVIGTVTSLIETGMCNAVEPETTVTLDTAVGLVRAVARLEGGRVTSVSFENVPAFVFQQELAVNHPELGRVMVDVAFGGNFFALVDARQIGLELVPANIQRLCGLGMQLLDLVNGAVTVRHPEQPHVDRVIDLRFTGAPVSPSAHSRNVVVLGDHMVDRSPCGTGTCAEMALRHARGQLRPGQPFVVESILNTTLTGEVIAETTVGQGAAVFPAIVPRVTGSAFLTGLHQFVLQPGDPFPQGFRL
jgi:proline racemase